MNPRNIRLSLRCTGILIALAACVAAAPAPSPKLDEILRKVGMHGAAKPDVLGKALAELPAADVATLCDMLVEPGTGDDTKPRMALEGLAWYVCSRGTSAQRAGYIEVLGAALAKGRTAGVKSFLIRQLQLVGDQSAVSTLGKFLLDEEVFDFAAQALVAIGGDGARETLRKAYADARGPRRVAIIQSLGVLGDRESVERLAEDVAGEDPDIRAAAIAALANIGAPAFWEAARKVECTSRYERSQLDALVFRMSDRLGGGAEAGADLAAELQSQEPYIRSAALFSTASPKAIDLVISFLADQDPQVRATAVDIAASLQGDGVTAAYVAKLDGAPEAVRAALIAVLAKRGDSAALEAVLNALQDDSKAVRLAAVNAAATLGQAAAIEPLIALLDNSDEDQRSAVQQALTQMRDTAAAGRVAAALASCRPGVQVALLKVLAESHALEQAGAICGCLEKGDDAVRGAALQAIETLAPPDALDPLVALLPKLKDPQQREACESALTAVCRRSTDRAELSERLLAGLRKDRLEDYCSLLRVLGNLGGAAAFPTVRESLSDSRTEVAEAAFRAISTWPDPAAASEILQVATSATELRNHVLALRAYIRLVAADQNLTSNERLTAYEKCVAQARRVDERKLLLSKIAELADARTISVLQRFLLDEQLRNEAGAALLVAAERLLPAGWQTARQAIWLALDAVDDETLRQRGRALLERVAECEDFVTDWQVAGPFEQEGGSYAELLDVPFPPEQAGAAGVDWRPQAVTTDRARFWYIDLNANPGLAGRNRAAYLRTFIDSARSQDVQFELGSDDGLKVWLNGEVIHTFADVRGCERGQDKVAAHLKQGRNEVLLKVTNGGGAWAACLRVRQLDGSHVEGLKIDLGQ